MDLQTGESMQWRLKTYSMDMQMQLNHARFLDHGYKNNNNKNIFDIICCSCTVVFRWCKSKWWIFEIEKHDII